MKQFYKKEDLIFEDVPTSKKFINLKDKKFNNLTVLGFAGRFNTQSYWYCECDCGNIIRCYGGDLKRHTTSCGCYQLKVATKHGHAKPGYWTRTYRTWTNMLNRCNNSKDVNYHKYGGRGIKVCDRWLTFTNFLEDMGERPERLTLDRIKNELGYYKENCRWATDIEQSNNKRSNHFLEFNQEKLTIKEWSRKLNINHNTLMKRIRLNWSIEKILTTPVNMNLSHTRNI